MKGGTANTEEADNGIVNRCLTFSVAPTRVTLGPTYRDGGNIEVNAGIEIQIACSTEYAKPAAQLIWYKNGEQISGNRSNSWSKVRC